MMSTYKPLSAPASEAMQLICQSSFHRVLWLPATSTHTRLRITYATTSNFGDESLPVIYYCGPLFPSRYHLVGFDHLAVMTGVRVVCIDRPAVGGTTPVNLHQRIPHFLSVLPAVLSALNVRNISLVSHSTGTIYLLNSLAKHRDLLHPIRPYVALMAPWVSTTSSHTMLTSVLDKLPSRVVGGLSSAVRLMNSTVLPAGHWSGGIFTAMGDLFAGGPRTGGQSEGEREVLPGLSTELAGEIEKTQARFMMMEETAGLNEEARLCLRKEGVLWEACGDYPAYVRQLVETERCRERDQGAQNLEVRAFFAESDVLLGKGGQRYFEECWKQAGVAEQIDYQGLEVSGTDHDSIVVDMKHGALKTIFEEVRANHFRA